MSFDLICLIHEWDAVQRRCRKCGMPDREFRFLQGPKPEINQQKPPLTIGQLINVITVMEQAMRELELSNPDARLSWRDVSGVDFDGSIRDWVEHTLGRVREQNKPPQ